MMTTMNMKTLLTSAVGATLIAGYVVIQDTRLDVFPSFGSLLNAVVPLSAQDDADANDASQLNTRNDYYKRLAAQLATGEGADSVVAVDVGFYGAFLHAGRFENLSGPAYQADILADGRADYTWQQGQAADGNQYAIPVDVGPRVMYYRRDILASIGADIEDVTASWTTYIDYGRALKDQGVFLVGDAADAAHLIINATIAEGDELYFDSAGNSLITSDRFVTAFQTARTIREEGLDGQISAWSTDWYDAFKQGTVATQMSGAWLLGHLQSWMAPDTADLWGATNLPNGIHGSWGASFLAIPKQAENKQAAWDFITYLHASEGTQIPGLETTGACPALKFTMNQAVFNIEMASFGGQNVLTPYIEVAQNMSAIAPMERNLIAKDIVDAALADVLDDGKDIMAALTQAELLLTQKLQ